MRCSPGSDAVPPGNICRLEGRSAADQGACRGNVLLSQRRLPKRQVAERAIVVAGSFLGGKLDGTIVSPQCRRRSAEASQ